MTRWLIDFETKSDYDLKKVAVQKYLSSPNSDIICMSYKEYLSAGVGKLWLPGHPPPFEITPDTKVHAFNMGTFDYRVWNLMGVQRYGFTPLNLSNCRDVMAVCGRFNFPQQLERAGRILKVNVVKSKRGKYLMKKICQPPFDYTPEELKEFYIYCLQDTVAMEELMKALPHFELEEAEQKVWELTMRVNYEGLPIDVRAVRKINSVCATHKALEMKKLPDLTDGQIQTVGQIAKIVNWCQNKGIDIDNLQAITVEKTLARKDLPPSVRRVLELRQSLGLSSTAKYSKILELIWEGRVYDNLRYYRAGTGRYGGQGFQAHNLPRATVNDVEAAIRAFINGAIYQIPDQLFYVAKALIRAIIKAPEGKVLVVSDFSSVEYIDLMWVAGQRDLVEAFRAGRDPYKEMAVELFHKAYEDITKEERTYTKPCVLGAGYNMSAGAYVEYADGYGVDVSSVESQRIIGIYRQRCPMVVKLWYALRDCALAAVANFGRNYTYNGTVFGCFRDKTGRSWLKMRLPSGRAILYCDPKIKNDKYGPVVTNMGIDPYTQQWTRLKLIPGRLTENVIQGIARDQLVHSKGLVAEKLPVLLSVHDEVVAEVNEATAEKDSEFVNTCMSTSPKWSLDLPLRADTFITKRYRKG